MSEHLSHQAREQDLQVMMASIIAKAKEYNPGSDEVRLWDAYRLGVESHGDQKRLSGEPYFVHALTTADTLADLRLDDDTLIAGLLHDVVEDTPVELAEVAEKFGADVAAMVDGVTKISEISSHNPETRRAENYRKLVLSIAKDPRTVLIKLADRLHNMRTIQYLPEGRQRGMAQETMDVYAQLAHRFGLARIKWELEDRSFKVLLPERYFAVESGIQQTRAEREHLIDEVRNPLAAALENAGLKAEIKGRPKHFYSIYRKMRDQNIELDRVYDLLALRVLVDSKVGCYHALGIVHSLFTPLQDRIKDYIANPKANMYQSLHTTVRAPGGKYVEIQIRTREMHERSEIGIAAHWKYKGGDSTDTIDYAGLVTSLRQIMEWQEDVTDPREFMESLKIDFFEDEVFVFSPRGDLFRLSKGATPLDFAFEVHSEVGLHCVGAKINGRIVSLGTALENRDVVEILTNKNAHPSTSWLETVKTVKAKHQVRRWIRSTQFEDSVRLGREILERELRREKLDLKIDRDLVEVAQHLGYTELDKMLAAVGCGDLTAQKVLHKACPPEPRQDHRNLMNLGKDIYANIMRRKVGGVRIQGLDSLMVRYARCCQPIPGDEVVGVVTRGRGVSVHRVGCSNLSGPNIEKERLIEVTWDVDPDQTFLVKVIVTGSDRKGMLADLGDAISSLGANIRGGDFTADRGLAKISFLVEVRNLSNLEKVLKAVGKVPSVEKVERYQIS